jgi:hypothetical protein
MFKKDGVMLLPGPVDLWSTDGVPVKAEVETEGATEAVALPAGEGDAVDAGDGDFTALYVLHNLSILKMD